MFGRNASQNRGMVESLENRNLFSTVVWTPGLLGSVAGSDSINVSQANTSTPGLFDVSVRLNGWVNATYQMTASDVLQIDAGPGNDDVFADLGVTVKMWFLGNTGLDTLTGTGGQDTLDGGDGADKLYGYGGADSLLGGAGNDSLEGSAGADILRGGDGQDTVLGGDADDQLFGGDDTDTISGGDGNDRVTNDEAGTFGADDVTGGLGNDTLEGGSASGTIVQAGAGDDTLTVGLAKSYLYGNEGADVFFCKNGVADGAIRGGPDYDIATVDASLDQATGILDSINVVYT